MFAQRNHLFLDPNQAQAQTSMRMIPLGFEMGQFTIRYALIWIKHKVNRPVCSDRQVRQVSEKSL